MSLINCSYFRKLFFTFCALFVCAELSNAQAKKWTLKDCIEYAFINDVALNQQRLVSEVSKINYKQAKDNKLPTLNLTDGQTFSFGNTINTIASQVVRQNTTSNDPSLNASVVLYSGNKVMNLVKETRLNFEASQYDIETQKNYLALNIAAAYIQVLFQYDGINIAQRQIDEDSVLVDKIQKYVAVGQTPEDSLLQIRAQLYTDKAAMINAENLLVLANVQLEQLMEMPISTSFEVERPGENEITPDVASSSADIYKMAESTFPEVKSAALKTNGFETDLAVSRAALLPTLSLNGSLTTEYYSALMRENVKTMYQDQTIGYLKSNPSEIVLGPVPLTSVNTQKYPFFDQFRDNFSQLISLNLTVPIFNNYKARNNIQLSKIAIENARLNEQAVKNTLRKSIEQAYTDQLAASKNYIATKEQLIAEQRFYTDMQTKYKVGLANITDLLIAEGNYYKAVLVNLQDKYEYIFKTKVIDFYTGIPLTK